MGGPPKTESFSESLRLRNAPGVEVPLQPIGLACDDNHSSLVIAERFALHEASLGTSLNMVTYVNMEHDMPQRCHRDAAGTDPFTWDFAAKPVTEWAGQVLGGRLSCPSGSTSLNKN